MTVRETTTDGIISALRDQVKDLERQYDGMARISQMEILRLQNDVARLTREKADLLIAVDAMREHDKISETNDNPCPDVAGKAPNG